VPVALVGVHVPVKRVEKGWRFAPAPVRSAVRIPAVVAVPGSDQVVSSGMRSTWPSRMRRMARLGRHWSEGWAGVAGPT